MSGTKQIDVTNTSLIKIAYPIVIENLLFLAFSSVDIFMLSGYSDSAVAAVGLMTQYTWFLITFMQVIPSGATISLTNLLGGKQFERAKALSRTCLQMIIFFAIIIGTAFATAVPQILKHYTLDEEVRQYATEYIIIYSAFCFFCGSALHLSHKVPVRIGAPQAAHGTRTEELLGISRYSFRKKYSIILRGTPVSRSITIAEVAPAFSK